MGIASILSGKASLSTFIDIGSLQPAEVERSAMIAWQWLVLAAVIVWAGTLAAEWRLLVALSGEQRPQVTSLLRMALQRRRRQGWLWLSIMFVGTLLLFWLRSIQVLPHEQPGELPDWPMLAQFLFSTFEGWLWLARGGVAFLAICLPIGSSFSAWRCTRASQKSHLPTADDRSRWRASESGEALGEMRQRRDKGRLSPGGPLTIYTYRHTRALSTMQQRLRGERRAIQRSIALAAAFLFTLALADSNAQGTRLYVTTLALDWVALLALAVWLGGMMYLVFVLIPATQVIESDERIQTLVALLPTLKPSITQAFIAMSLYIIFSVEAHLSGASTLLEMARMPYGWAIIAAAGLLGLMALFTSYQERRILPALARMAWLAACGPLTSVLGGIDVARSLQISQHERQGLARLAERRFKHTLYALVVLGLLVLLCLVLASTSAPPLTT